MNKRELYLEAARRVAEGEHSKMALFPELGACWAIAEVSEPNAIKRLNQYEGVAEFTAMFRPTGQEVEEYGCWTAWWLQSYGESEKETQHCRVIALCLAAEALGEDL